jgi:UDP-N-acetylglucosamine transferase subunit ALG13
MLVVGRSGVGSLLVVGEESKPHIMVEKHQD